MRKLLALTAAVAAFVCAAPALAQTPPASGSSSAVRLALQGRLTAVQYTETRGLGVGPGDVGVPQSTLAPYATAGVRLIDSRLFVGLGLGFGSYSFKDCGATCDDYRSVSRGYFGLSPVVSFDFLRSGPAALYGLGWLTFGSIGGSTVVIETPGARNTTETRDGGSALGASLAVGIRANIVDGLAIGTEWGWGFASYVFDGREAGDAQDESVFTHGMFGTVMIEGSLGL
jgi:hypothetical protein